VYQQRPQPQTVVVRDRRSHGMGNMATGMYCTVKLLIGRVSYLIYVFMRHYVLTTSGDIVVCFHTAVCLSCQFVNYVMTFSICYWANYTQGKMKSGNAVADNRILKFLYDADLAVRHVESSVRCHRKYKNGRIKVDLG